MLSFYWFLYPFLAHSPEAHFLATNLMVAITAALSLCLRIAAARIVLQSKLDPGFLLSASLFDLFSMSFLSTGILFRFIPYPSGILGLASYSFLYVVPSFFANLMVFKGNARSLSALRNLKISLSSLSMSILSIAILCLLLLKGEFYFYQLLGG